MIMADGLLSLSWNNHSSTFCHMLSTVRGLEKYSDVTLACDGRFYPAHKLVLSTCSDYFHKMFERTPCKHPVIVIKDVESKDIEALLSYMYAGIVNVSQNDLAQLIKAAELLEIKGLAVPDEPPLISKRGSHTRSSSASPHRKRRKQEDRSSPGRHDTTPSSSSPRPKIAFGQSASGRQQDRKGQKHEEEKKGKIRSCEDDTDEQQPLTDQGERQVRNSVESSENQADGLNNSIKEEKVELASDGDGGVGGYEYGMLLGGMQEEGEDQGSASTPFSTTEHSFHSNPGPSGLQGWSGVGNGGESSQGYGGDLSQDLQLGGHLGTQAQQLHQVVDVKGGVEESGFVPDYTTTPPSPTHHCYHHQHHHHQQQQHQSSIFPNNTQGHSGNNPPGDGKTMEPHLQTPLELQKSPSNIDPDSNSASFDNIKHSHIQTTTVLALHESQCGINTGSVSASVQPNLHAATTSTALQGVQSIIDPNTNSSVVYKLKQPHATPPPPPALYKCPHCPYKSSYRTNVTTHLRKHTGERPYTCYYCDYNSSYKSNMNRHIQRHFTEN